MLHHFARPLNRISLGTIGLAVAATLAGCVPAEDYDAMKMKADQYAEQLGRSETQLASEKMRGDLLEKQMAAMNNGDAASGALVKNQETQIEELRKQVDDDNRRYAEAMATLSHAGQQQALPTGLNDQLKDFAAKNPDMIDFDPSHGVVKFKSDVTFPSGDSTVSASAQAVLTKFATILGSAEGYELLVAGHTDSTPITNPQTIAKGNFDNWYLSAHRAIAVGKELIADGVSAKRIGMVGYADPRPVSASATKAANRRVEVLILPTSRSSGFAGTAGHTHKPRPTATPAAPTPVNAGATLSKDGGAPPTTPPPPPTPVVPLTK
jgi:chemotaxis protein MotB